MQIHVAAVGVPSGALQPGGNPALEPKLASLGDCQAAPVGRVKALGDIDADAGVKGFCLAALGERLDMTFAALVDVVGNPSLPRFPRPRSRSACVPTSVIPSL